MILESAEVVSYVQGGWRAASELRLHRQQIVNGCVFVAAVCFQHGLYHVNLDVRKHVVHGSNIFICDRLSRGRLRLRCITCIHWYS